MRRPKTLVASVGFLSQNMAHLLIILAEKYKPQLSVEDIENILGIERYDDEIAEKTR